MKRYKVVLHPRVSRQLALHAAYIARVSKSAAIRFRREFEEIIRRMEVNPMLFPPYDTAPPRKETYRKALFAVWYKAIFSVEDNTVYIDAVIDGRRDREDNLTS
ncbi:MAG: type II toxin-antitoxin system RelE/ParE family toxin [Oscillospiraceae bacterium]|nr:type II toxin-antitoxin system RelE/ParE family toxin [Oscillospiraceae bacterium]